MSYLPNLAILDGEILDEDKLEDDKDSISTSIHEESDMVSNRKPGIVTAISLMLAELENLDDIEQIQKEVELRAKKVKDSSSDVFTV